MGVGLATAGCGDKGSAADGTLLKDMSLADAKALCEFQRDLYIQGLTTAEAYCFETRYPEAATCESELQECLDSGDYEAELEDDWDCDQTTLQDYVDGSDCDATIADYKACGKAEQRSYKAHYARATCDDPDSIEPPDDTAQCLALFDKCPDLS
jgi:hypothetical protein